MVKVIPDKGSIPPNIRNHVKPRKGGISFSGIGSARESICDKYIHDKYIINRNIKSPRREHHKGRVLEPSEHPRNPRYEIYHGKDNYMIILDIPHHSLEDIVVDLSGDVLKVESKIKKYLREFLVPSEFNKPKIDFRNNILSITFVRKK